MGNICIAIPQMGNDLFRMYMKSKYVQSLRRSGADVDWIGTDNHAQSFRRASECDGLLLPGGPDLAPEMYGQERLDKTGKPNTDRDRTEPQLLKMFLDAGKPILGICRGIQLMNVYFGGNLLQDIKDMQEYRHSDFLSRSRSTHPVEIKKDSRLFHCLGQTRLDVNSIHHQAIDKVGNGLIVCATSADGFIEGVELPDYRFCIGVQWHPEHMSAHNPKEQALFDAFVAACASG